MTSAPRHDIILLNVNKRCENCRVVTRLKQSHLWLLDCVCTSHTPLEYLSQNDSVVVLQSERWHEKST